MPPQQPPLLNRLERFSDLEALAHSRCVMLVSRGHTPELADAATRMFLSASMVLAARHPQQLSFAIVDDASDAACSSALLTRLGLEHTVPFVLILDRFADTEEKYLMPQRSMPSVSEVEQFVENFLSGKLQPAMLGQDRPPRDRCESFPALWEVVTASFDDVVLDPSADVLLETQSPRCDACKALGPRMRMLAAFAARYAPQLRIATMNILDNDKQRAYLPEVSYRVLEHTSPPS
jgi:thiol-disulfide isomerase/thioredoxin